MRVIYPTGTYTQFFGRSPSYSNNGYGNWAVNPHADTTRASYTVPANRRAVLTGCMCHILRVTVAAPVGNAAIYVISTIGGGGFYSCIAELLTNNIGDQQTALFSGQAWLTAGDTVELHTLDISTGGTVTYRGSFCIVEFSP
jgi:hypothetical protein